MRLVLITIVILASFAIIKSYADDSNTFGVRLVPDKMIKNSSGILEVYALHNNLVLPTKIKNVVFSSTDSSILQIVGTGSNDTNFATHVQIRANNPGTANIIIAAPGFASQEFPITVYADEVSPTALLVKATPMMFSINGPKTGYLSIEMVNAAGLPTLAQQDVHVAVASTNSQVLSLSSSNLTIKSGQYYTVEQFQTNQIGSASIIASAPSFQSVSTTVTVASANPPTIQAYVYPSKINDFATSTAYVVAQLKDSSGNEMLAKNDIPLSILITNSTATGLVNTSPQGQLISSNGQLIIKKGEYEGFGTIQITAGLNGTFKVGLSAPEGYLISNHTAPSIACALTSGCSASTTSLLKTPITFSTVTAQILGDKSARLDVLPMLATGKNELIGVMHLEDPHGKPVIANKNLQIEVDSSDSNYLSVGPVQMSQGSADALVYGKIGNIAPPYSSSTSTALSLHIITYNDTTVPVAINSSSTNSFKLIADPLISKALTQSSFPLALYLVDSSNALSSFPNDYQPTILPNDYFQINPNKISNGDSIDLFDVQSIKNGSATLHIITGSYSTAATLSSSNSSPSAIDMNYPNPLLANYTNLLGIQVLDSNSNPVYLNSDIPLKMISSNDTVVSPPTNVVISKGSYYSKFEVVPKLPGTATVSVVADNLPLATYQMQVESMIPKVIINAPSITNPGGTFFANVTATRNDQPLPNLNIVWKVSGAIIQKANETTNQNGTANVSLLPNSNGTITIDALVSGNGFNPFKLEKTVQINSTQTGLNSTDSTSATSGIKKSLKINGIDPLPLVIVGSIAAGGILVKKKNIRLPKRTSK